MNLIGNLKNITSKVVSLMNYTLLLVVMLSCESFLEVDPPKSKIPGDLVFNNDVTANAAVMGIYVSLVESQSFASGDYASVTMLCGLSADELVNYPRNSVVPVEFDENDLSSQNAYVLNLWTSIYKTIYMANAAIEGLANAKSVTMATRTQLEGEALFVRAFSHFYLVNLFEDIPLITSTDYIINSTASRSSEEEVYGQIIEDLINAKELLNENYIYNERIRPNKAAAEALLARVYLFIKDWEQAEAEATLVIDNVASYKLVSDLDKIFLANSDEAIWQLRPIVSGANGYVNEAYFFTPPVFANFNILNKAIANAFETADSRFTHWIGSYGSGGNTVYFPHKYKQNEGGDLLSEYSMVLRLAEQYLIRAEARAHQNKLTGPNSAESDIDAIRNRAGLTNTSAASQDQLLNAIEQERKVELFTEWGHRWLDLKRTSRADMVLDPIKLKWNANDRLYPIPQSERNKNPNLRPQNLGY